MAPSSGPVPVPVAELRARLASPFALEELAWSPVPVVSATISRDDRPDDGELEALLTSVRAVSVGVVAEPLGRAAAMVAASFDILIATPDLAGDAVVPVGDVDTALASVASAVGAHPRAAVAMAELLRLRAYESVPRGLVAESLTYSTLQSGPEFAAWLAQRGPAELPPDEAPPVLTGRAGTALTITLNRPHRANAVTAAMRDQLVEALRVAATDPSIEGVILRGAGPSFCSGGDLAEFGSLPDPAEAHAIRVSRSPAWWVWRLARDVRVELHGSCIGAGIEVPSFAGTIMAAPDTRVRLPEVGMGLVPGAGGTVGLARRIGPHRCAYLAITGVELDAADALSWGIVDRVE